MTAFKRLTTFAAFDSRMRLVDIAPLPILPTTIEPEATRVCWPPYSNVTTAMSGKSGFDPVLEIGHSVEHNSQQWSA